MTSNINSIVIPSTAQGAVVPIIRPTLPPLEEVMALLRPSYEAGIVTCGKLVAELERSVEAYTGTRHAVMLSSCASGLMLAYTAMVEVISWMSGRLY